MSYREVNVGHADGNLSIPAVLASGRAKGDMIYQSLVTAGLEWARLAIGATDEVISVASGIPAFKSVATLLANTMSNTRGMLLRRGASAWEAFAANTANQIVAGDSAGTDVTSRTLLSIIQSITGAFSNQGEMLYKDGSGLAALTRPVVQSILTQAGGANNLAWKFFALKVKAANEDTSLRAASMTDDTDLKCTLDVNKTYAFFVVCQFNIAGTTSDLKFDFNYTGTAPGANGYMERSFETNGTTIQNKGKVTSIGADTVVDYSSTADGVIIFAGMITTGASSGGVFSFRWAENSSGTDNTIYRGSFMLVMEAN